MITKLRLKELIVYKARLGSPTLSVYLDIDQSDAATRLQKAGGIGAFLR